MDEIDKIESKTMATQVLERLRRDILKKNIPPKTRITINDISKRYGVSNMPVREAFHVLYGERLLELIPYKGARVLALDNIFLSQVNDLLCALERMFIEESIKQGIGKELIEELREINNKIAVLTTKPQMSEERLKYNRQFHKLMFLAYKGTVSMEVYEQHYNLLQSVRKEYSISLERNKQSVEEHEALICALENGDIDRAIEAIRTHELNAKKCILNQINCDN